MRVTSNLFPQNLKDQLQLLQRRQLVSQNQISTGLKLQKSSENPVEFNQAQRLSAKQAEFKSFQNAIGQAVTIGESNYTAMADLNRLLTRASELSFRSTGGASPDELNAIAVEFNSIVDQVVDLANRKDNKGNFLFGGTVNVAPILDTGNPIPAQYAYNPAATNNVTSAVVIPGGSAVDTGFVAGRTGAGAFEGFMRNATVDTLALLQTIQGQLNGAPPTQVQPTELQSLDDAIALSSEFVGRSAARLSALELNESTINDFVRTGSLQLQEATAASLTDALTELQRTQLHYQAALQSGAQILSLSFLDYVR